MQMDTGLANWLAAHPIPAPRVGAGHPLFNGTLVFVQVTYNRPNQPPFAMNAADIQTAVAYAARAVVPIQRYATQYGTNAVAVSPTMLTFTANLKGNTFSDNDVQGFVDDIAAANGLTRSCVVILHDSITAGGPVNSDASDAKKVDGYHSRTDNGNPYCFCRVHGTSLTVADRNDRYAGLLSHEIAEMVVDPHGHVENPEVCDACFFNCENPRFDLFDRDNAFLGGTDNPATTPVPFTYFIDSLIKPEFYDPDTECATKGSDLAAVCVYPPPPTWSGPGQLTTVGGLVSVSGHFASADQHDIVLAGTTAGTVREIFWKSDTVGVEGEDNLPVPFGQGSIVSVASLYNNDNQRHVAVVGTTAGRVHEIFWKSDTVGVEGHDDLPVDFAPNSIVAVSGLYASDQQRHLVVVGTTAGKVHEIFWKSDSVGVEGHDDLPIDFAPNSIVGLCAFYNIDDRRHIVLVGTAAGKVHEIFWKADTVGVEGHDNLPLDFGNGGIVAVAGLYDIHRQRHVAVVAASDGKVHEIYWKTFTVGIEAHSVVAQFDGGSIVSVAGFYSESDQVEHIVVGLSNGRIEEFWLEPGA
jgi:hypothetical protein